MPPPVVLITGTSSGIGLSTSVAAARSGYTTVATMRNVKGDSALRAAADGARIELDVRPLDVTQEDSVRSCVDSVVAGQGRLDAVVNNAGAGHVGTIETMSVDGSDR